LFGESLEEQHLEAMLAALNDALCRLADSGSLAQDADAANQVKQFMQEIVQIKRFSLIYMMAAAPVKATAKQVCVCTHACKLYSSTIVVPVHHE
jgi:5'-deoxynucleotidase YfbR-like HD superfamily hydrolase